MKRRAKHLLIQLLVLALLASVAFAQTETPATDGHVYTQPELDQLLAPIALYPDSLLSQILIAATYPLEVVEAARWSQANSHLKGEQAVRAVDERNWDPSVKSLVAFPQILNMLDTKLEWTEQLGDAFLAQQSDVMEEVQSLRQRAYSAGNLPSSEQQRVERQGDTVAIEPSSPTVVYVPYYDPAVVYGPWWWPAYPPVYWGPWPGYYVSPGFAGITWGIGIGVGVNFFFSAWDWPHRYIRIVDARPFYYHRVDRRPLPSGNVWHHDPEHRRGVPYRNPSVREQFRRSVPSPEQRREYRGYVPRLPEGRVEPGRGEIRPGTGSRPPEEHRVAPPTGGGERLRPNTPAVRPVPGSPSTPGVRSVPSRPNVSSPVTRPAPEPRPHAFEGVGRGQDVRRYSERGHISAPPRPPVVNRAPAQQPSGRAPPSGGSRDGGGTYRR